MLVQKLRFLLYILFTIFDNFVHYYKLIVHNISKNTLQSQYL